MLKVTPIALLVLFTATTLVLAQAKEPKLPAGRAQQGLLDDRQQKQPPEQQERPAAAAEDEQKVPAEGGDAAAPGEEDRLTQAQLDRTLPEVAFDGVGFTDVIDFLRDVTNANVFVNWRALEAAGIDRNAPVTARPRQAKFGKALDVILDGVGGEKGKLAYDTDDGVITISTAEDLGRNTHTRVYDVRDLLRPAADAPDAAQAKRLASLTKLITGSVAPKTWREQGGTIGGVRELQGQLIITQTAEHHDTIANLLSQTRSLMGLEPVEGPAPVVREPKE